MEIIGFEPIHPVWKTGNLPINLYAIKLNIYNTSAVQGKYQIKQLKNRMEINNKIRFW